MVAQESPKTLEDVLLWIAAHSATVEGKWDTQEKWNRSCDHRWREAAADNRERDNKIGALERRVAILCTTAAAAGGLAGSLLSGILG